MRSERHLVEHLPVPPSTLAGTRAALHRLAVYVVSPAREAVTGRIGLRASGDGFATPLFGDDERQVAIVGDELVLSSVDGAERIAITTLRDAAAFVGVDVDPTRAERFDVPEAGDLDARLTVDAAASRWLGSWYAFGDSILEALRAGFSAPENVGIVQLWPEHFDLAVDGGDAEHHQRANYGFSPGDARIDEPYFYVGPWDSDGLDDPFWGGEPWAPLPLGDILAASDPRPFVLDFARTGRELLRRRT